MGLTLVLGMRLQCADFRDGQLTPNDGSITKIETACVRWLPASSLPPFTASSTYFTPVYLYSDRKDLLFTVPLKCQPGTLDILTQTGVALLAGE